MHISFCSIANIDRCRLPRRAGDYMIQICSDDEPHIDVSFRQVGARPHCIWPSYIPYIAVPSCSNFGAFSHTGSHAYGHFLDVF